MHQIIVEHFSKHYRVAQSHSGLLGGITSFVAPDYKDISAVDDISFTIKEGELVGFIGPNGAGKTTTLKCLSGLLYPTSGVLSVLGHMPFAKKKEFLQNIALVMGQKNQLWWDLPPMETFLLNKAIYEISNTQFNQTLDELVDLLHISEILNQPVRKLSLGQRMKCELVAALIHRPKVLFLDEPTIGLDVMMQKVVRDFIKEYNKKFNATVLLTSHYMDDIEYLCKRVMVINEGHLMYDGSIDKLVKNVTSHKEISLEDTIRHLFESKH